MVYFVCESCNETLKKAQVDRHLYSCKNCWGVTCVDCNFTFEGDSFRKHTSCVSEEQKYQGALFKAPKAKQKNRGVNEIWADAVSLAARNASTGVAPKPLCHHLTRMGDLGNVPRQEKKFKNFVKNSLRVFDEGSVSKLWDYMDGVKNDIAQAEKAAAPPPPVAAAAKETLPAPAAEEVEKEEAGVEEKAAGKTKKSKKSKKRARGKEDESGEKREDGSSGTEKRPRGEGKQQEEEGQEQQQQPGEGGAGAANGGVGGGDVDAATRKALAKAAIGIVKKAPNKRIAVKELTKQTAAVVLAARKNDGNTESSGTEGQQLPDERQLRRALKRRLQEEGSGGLKRVTVEGKVAVYSKEAEQS